TFSDGGNSSNLFTFGGGNEILNLSPETLLFDTGMTDGGTLIVANSSTVILAGSNGGTSGIEIQGSGSASGGTLQIGDGGTTGSPGTGSIQFLTASGQTLPSTLDFDLSDAASFSNSMKVTGTTGVIIQQSGGGTLTLTGSESLGASGTAAYDIGSTGSVYDAIISGSMSGSAPVVKSGAGTLELTGSSSYAGPLVINAGALTVGGSGFLGSGNDTGAVTIASGASLVYDSSAAQTISGVISGAGSLVESGPGTLTLSASETDTGDTTINGGNLTLAGYNGSGALQGALSASANVTVSNGGTLQFGRFADNGNSATGSAPAAGIIAQNVTLNNGAFAVTSGTTNSADEATAVALSGTLTLASGLNFVTLSGTNLGGVSTTYVGLTTGFSRNAGTTLLINATHTVGQSSPGTAGAENMILTSGTTEIDGLLPGVFLGQSSTPLDATTVASYSSTKGVTTPGTVSYTSGGSGTLENDTYGYVTVVNPDGFTGTASGAVAGLRMDGSLNLGGYTLTVNSGMILSRGSFNITTGTLAFGGAEGQIYVSNNDTTHATNAAHSMTISSVITGGNGVTYTGGWTGQGTLTLSGDDTYTGVTTINTGTMIVSGSLAGTSAVTINDTGVLGGSGMVGEIGATGTTTVSAGGAIFPGAISGTAGTTLTLNNSVLFQNGSTFDVNLDATGDHADLLAINGNLTLSGSDNLTVNLINGSLPADAAYVIATYTGTLSGTFLTPANLTAEGYKVDYTSDPGEIVIDAIPEGGPCGLILGGIGLLIGFRRIFQRKSA
ncbi:MAG TPA: autotransporter-associated beta strand repeat-containing protein, partial [Chthoniobacteraceae bacterium]|nr:autotransporter-associated beta strand repeat-containing protein [Chthoniobacteraceae bacterium]